MDLFLNMVRGFCMALADSVPGVSGGTIAFVLGFYDEFIGSLYVLTPKPLWWIPSKTIRSIRWCSGLIWMWKVPRSS